MTIPYRFVLYSNNIKGIKEYEKINGEYTKLDEPIKLKMFGVYRHSFPSLHRAIRSWPGWIQILSFKRFYHSIGVDKKSYLAMGTKFNILLLPVIWIYALIDTQMFHCVAFV